MDELLNEIKLLEEREYILKGKINKWVFDHIAKSIDDAISLRDLSLEHRIYDREVSYMTNEFDDVMVYSGKGWCTKLRYLSFYDLKKIINKLGF